MEVNSRLVAQGIDVMAASLNHMGLFPPRYKDKVLPYWVAPLSQQDWLNQFALVANQFQPDIVCIIKDLTYIELINNAMIAWSGIKRVIVTPIDGKPIAPRWIEALKSADAVVSMSQFGVTALAEQGISAYCICPGVDTDEFFPIAQEEKLVLRRRVGIPDTAFVLATMAENQSRKAIPHMLEGFFRFAQDKPDAYYLLDMLPVAMGGWDLPFLCEQFGWDVSKLIFRKDVLDLSLRERYHLSTVHAVLSYREGWGLPLVEAMACGILSMALDWCSGTEICGDGKAILIKPLDYKTVSTWGNALDYHPDTTDFADKLNWLYQHPQEVQNIAQRGMAWSRALTWDLTANKLLSIFQSL